MVISASNYSYRMHKKMCSSWSPHSVSYVPIARDSRVCQGHSSSLQSWQPSKENKHRTPKNHKRQGDCESSRKATIDEILWLAKSKQVTIWGITGELPVPTFAWVFLRKISNLFADSLLTWFLDRHIPRKRDQGGDSVEGPFFSKGLTETECGLLRRVSL